MRAKYGVLRVSNEIRAVASNPPELRFFHDRDPDQSRSYLQSENRARAGQYACTRVPRIPAMLTDSGASTRAASAPAAAVRMSEK